MPKEKHTSSQVPSDSLCLDYWGGQNYVLFGSTTSLLQFSLAATYGTLNPSDPGQSQQTTSHRAT